MLLWDCYGILLPARNLAQRITECLWTGESMAWEDCCRNKFDKLMKSCSKWSFIWGLYFIWLLLVITSCCSSAADLDVELSGSCWFENELITCGSSSGQIK
jgi:hypothetical protein